VKILHIDEKWSIRYDDTFNDRPVEILRYGVAQGDGIANWDNVKMSMFYALLEVRERR
jgi:hypothetical protein